MRGNDRSASQISLKCIDGYWVDICTLTADGVCLRQYTFPRPLLDALTSVSGGQPLADGTYDLPLRPTPRKEP